MTVYFVDTSSLAKRYVVETGSAWVVSWAEPIAGNIIIIAQLTTVEMFSLLVRRQREGTLSAVNTTALQTDFLHHSEMEYLVMQVDTAVYTRARGLVKQHPLRALDAIQLATAQEAAILLNEPITFISADTNLLNAAMAEGFSTDNPLLHP